MARALIFLAVLCGGVLVVGLWLTGPNRLPPGAMAGLTGDAERGARVFALGGCASCHAAPGAEGEAKLILAGGKRFASPFGTFVAPNISPSAAGIAGWSAEDLANAMLRGVSQEGAHYYPAFPYASYVRAAPQDAADLKAYLDTLPPDDTASAPHEIPFPFNIRRSLALWKALFVDPAPVRPGPGAALVEGLGHCAECHTPRGALGGLDQGRWMAGAPAPDGKGRIPNITPHEDGVGAWSEADLASYLTTGFTPEYDVVGGEMAEVVAELAKLPEEDIAAIVQYLKALPPLPDAR